jgi:MOSC domain-containing protein YiiM
MTTFTGTVLGLQRKEKVRGALELIETANVSVEKGIEGDARGILKNAQITIVSKDAWAAAMAELQPTREVSWSERRANVFVDGMEFFETTGARISIGEVELEVMSETDPCEMMDKAYPGLKDALTPDWRGGCRCRVLQGGTIKLGDTITMMRS